MAFECMELCSSADVPDDDACISTSRNQDIAVHNSRADDRFDEVRVTSILL